MNCVDLRIGYVLLDIIIIIVVNNCRSFIKIWRYLIEVFGIRCGLW